MINKPKKWSTLRDRHPPRTVTKVTEFFWKFEAGFYSRIPWICTTGDGSKFKKQGRTDVRCLPRFCYSNHPISLVSKSWYDLTPSPNSKHCCFVGHHSLFWAAQIPVRVFFWPIYIQYIPIVARTHLEHIFDKSLSDTNTIQYQHEKTKK